MKTLRKFQDEGVEFLLSGPRKLLLDDMGLGKTLQAVVAANNSGAHSVVVTCPPATLLSWKKCFEEETNMSVDIAQGMKYTIELDCQVLIVPYSICSSPKIVYQIRERQWDILILDEAHYLKSLSSQRSRAVLSNKGIVRNFETVWALSGTLMINRPIELYPLLKVLRPPEIDKKFVSYPYFTKVFCDAKMRFNRLDVSGARNLDKLSKLLFDTGFALRRTRKEVLKDLKPVTINMIPVAELKEPDSRIDASDIKRVVINLEDTSMAELRKETAIQKIDGCLEYVKYILESGKKVVVFTWTKEVTERLCCALRSHGALTYYGKDTTVRKQKHKEAFETSDKHNALICNIVSAGTGLDGLQYVCDHCIFVEPDWTPAGMNQAIARLSRWGQTNPVTADILLTRDSVEEYIMHSVLRKTKNINILMRKGT